MKLSMLHFAKQIAEISTEPKRNKTQKCFSLDAQSHPPLWIWWKEFLPSFNICAQDIDRNDCELCWSCDSEHLSSAHLQKVPGTLVLDA